MKSLILRLKNMYDALASYIFHNLIEDNSPEEFFPKTFDDLGSFQGNAKRMDDEDLPRIGATIGVGEDEIHAVLDVEARGSGFDNRGRPKMLFEPHVFYRMLKSKGTPAELQKAVSAGLAYKSWKRNYPKDSYPRLIKAMKINPELALQSASWGLGQVMGFNYGAAGFSSVLEMVWSFMNDEEMHLEAMVNFIIANELDDELRNHDWRGFARGYNGASYHVHGYHTRLKQAFIKWKRIPDTPYSRTA